MYIALALLLLLLVLPEQNMQLQVQGEAVHTLGSQHPSAATAQVVNHLLIFPM